MCKFLCVTFSDVALVINFVTIVPKYGDPCTFNLIAEALVNIICVCYMHLGIILLASVSL